MEWRWLLPSNLFALRNAKMFHDKLMASFHLFLLRNTVVRKKKTFFFILTLTKSPGFPKCKEEKCGKIELQCWFRIKEKFTYIANSLKLFNIFILTLDPAFKTVGISSTPYSLETSSDLWYYCSVSRKLPTSSLQTYSQADFKSELLFGTGQYLETGIYLPRSRFSSRCVAVEHYVGIQ